MYESRCGCDERNTALAEPSNAPCQVENAKDNDRSNTVLMVCPLPVEGSYIGGIGVSMRRLINHWSLPTPMVHFNTELCRRVYGTTGQLNWRNLALCLINFVRLFCSIIRMRPSIVHYHTSRGKAFLKDMLCAGLLRRLFRIKMVVHIRSSDSATILMSRTARLQRFQIAILQHCCDRVVLLSENVLDDFVRVFEPEAGHRFRSRCTVLPNFTLLPDAYREHASVRDYIRLFYIGNIGREKGIYDTIEAVRRLKDEQTVPFKLVLAGPFNDEREERQIRAKVSDCQLDQIVVFLGTVSGEAKEAAFLEADIFVLPSHSEGIPQSMLEAMAYGLPVVVSSVGGIPEVVQDGTEGRIIRPRDVDGLCQALGDLIKSVECRRRMGAAARHRIAAHYTVDIYMRQLEDLYNSLLVRQERIESTVRTG